MGQGCSTPLNGGKSKDSCKPCLISMDSHFFPQTFDPALTNLNSAQLWSWHWICRGFPEEWGRLGVERGICFQVRGLLYLQLYMCFLLPPACPGSFFFLGGGRFEVFAGGCWNHSKIGWFYTFLKKFAQGFSEVQSQSFPQFPPPPVKLLITSYSKIFWILFPVPLYR